MFDLQNFHKGSQNNLIKLSTRRFWSRRKSSEERKEGRKEGRAVFPRAIPNETLSRAMRAKIAELNFRSGRQNGHPLGTNSAAYMKSGDVRKRIQKANFIHRSDSLLPPRLPLFSFFLFCTCTNVQRKERHTRNVPQDVQPKRRKACVNKNMRIKPYNYYYNYRQTLP